jgi:hypothetical protein
VRVALEAVLAACGAGRQAVGADETALRAAEALGAQRSGVGGRVLGGADGLGQQLEEAGAAAPGLGLDRRDQRTVVAQAEARAPSQRALDLAGSVAGSLSRSLRSRPRAKVSSSSTPKPNAKESPSTRMRRMPGGLLPVCSGPRRPREFTATCTENSLSSCTVRAPGRSE